MDKPIEKTIGKSALKVLRNLQKKITFEVFLVNNFSEAKAIVHCAERNSSKNRCKECFHGEALQRSPRAGFIIN